MVVLDHREDLWPKLPSIKGKHTRTHAHMHLKLLHKILWYILWSAKEINKLFTLSLFTF